MKGHTKIFSFITFKICKNQHCKSFIPYFQQNEWVLWEINGNKYLTLVPTNESKEEIKRHEDVRSKIWDLISLIIRNLDSYNEKYMKIKFNSDEKLPLKKTIEIPSMIIVVWTKLKVNLWNCYKIFIWLKKVGHYKIKHQEQFWSCKFTSSYKLNDKLKVVNYKLKYISKKMKKIIRFGDIEIQKQKFHQHKRPIFKKNKDIGKSVLPNKVSLGKKRFKYLIGYKDDKK